MATGISLHIGLNSVDPSHYQGWSGPLTACEADAISMEAIATDRGFSARKLLTSSATRKAVLDQLADAAHKLAPGDIFFLTYSGHGGQVPDVDFDEDDNEDETWCLFDGQLIDDELKGKLAAFRQGVRILVLSDSCHSGTVIKAAYYYNNSSVSVLDITAQRTRPVYRAMPSDVALRVYTANRKFYDDLEKQVSLDKSTEDIDASALLISGCQDNQLSADGAFNGLFTGTLLRVWANGGFDKGYRELHAAIVRRMPPDQTPNYFTLGPVDKVFEKQTPFTI